MAEVVEELFGGVEGEAVHGARNVNDEEVVAGWNVLGGDAGGRLDGELEKVLVVTFVEKETAGDGLVGETVVDEEVAIVTEVVARALPRKFSALFGSEFDVDGMAGGLDGLKGEASAESEVEAEGGWGGCVFAQEGVGDGLVGVGSFIAAITWSKGGGKDELIDAVFGLEEFGVVQLDSDFVAGENARYRHLKEVGSVLFEKSGGLALALGFFEGLFGFFFFLNLGGDGAVADGHGHAVDGGASGSREEVGGIERLSAFVGEGLSEGDLSKRASDGDLSVGRL